MSDMSQKKQSTVYWWIGWIVLTIVSFFISCAFWTHILSVYVGPMSQKGVPILWVASVFGSWMVLLVPLIVVMYNKVDRAYEDGRLEREEKEALKLKKQLGVRSVDVPQKDRLIPKEMKEKLKKIVPAVPRGHLLNILLKDGRRINHVFILDRHEILGIYNQNEFSFNLQDIADWEPSDLDQLPLFETGKWLRLDGVGLPSAA